MQTTRTSRPTRGKPANDVASVINMQGARKPGSQNWRRLLALFRLKPPPGGRNLNQNGLTIQTRASSTLHHIIHDHSHANNVTHERIPTICTKLKDARFPSELSFKASACQCCCPAAANAASQNADACRHCCCRVFTGGAVDHGPGPDL